MSSYNPLVNYAAKDSLASGDPLKRIKGTEISAELNAISSAIASKADLASPVFTGTPSAPTAAPGTNTTQLATTAFVAASFAPLASPAFTGEPTMPRWSVNGITIPVNGAYLPSANTLGFATNSVLRASISTALASIVLPLTVNTVNVTDSTVPANGIYLSAANTLAFASNTTARGNINSTGNWSISAPASGTTLHVVSTAGGVPATVSDGTIIGYLAALTGSTMQYGTATNHAMALLANGSVRLNITGAGVVTVNDLGGTMRNVGLLESPIAQQDANYTLVLADGGRTIYHTSASAHTWTIPANGSTAFPIGTVISLVNGYSGAGAVTIAITTDTLVWLPGATSTGSRTLAPGGRATIQKVEATRWVISGVGLT